MRITICAVACVTVLAACSGSHMPAVPNAPSGTITQMPKSVSPALIKPAPMAKTAILPSGAMRSPRKTAVAIQGPNWTQVPGTASGAAAAPDGSLWVLSDQPAGADKYIWHYAGGTWTNITGLADHLAVAPNGTLYAVNSGGGVYAYSSGTWAGLGGGANSVTVASDGSVYVTSNAGSGDQAIWHYASGAWSQAPGAGAVLTSSWDTKSYTLSNGTVSANGTYILNAEGSIYYENANASFVQLPGAASAIAPTKSGGVFVLGYPTSASGEALYYYNLDSASWTAESGAGVSISTDGSTLYVVSASGTIYSTPVTPTPVVNYYAPGGNLPPIDITSGPDGSLWMTLQNDKYGIATTAGKVTIGTAAVAGGTNPQEIVTGPDGNLWFTESNSTKIGKMTTGGILAEYALPGLGGPVAIAAGPDGNMWVTDAYANIDQVSMSGAFTTYHVHNSACGGCLLHIISGPDGNMWFIDLTGQNSSAIGKMTMSGGVTEYTVPVAGQAYDLTSGPDGNIWFVTYYGDVFKLTPTGTFTDYGAVGASGGIVSWNGNIWFGAGANITEITPSGSISNYPLPNPNEQVRDLTVGSDGRLWFITYDYVGNFVP